MSLVISSDTVISVYRSGNYSGNYKIIQNRYGSMEKNFISEKIKSRKELTDKLQNLDFAFEAGDSKYFIISNYYDLRFEKRDKSKTWPEKLSKKEVVLCKIEMIKAILTLTQLALERSGTVNDTATKLLREVKTIESGVYTLNTSNYQTNSNGDRYYKYPGLVKEDADFLNEIYKILIKVQRLAEILEPYQKKS